MMRECLISDEIFFNEVLDLESVELSAVKRAVQCQNYAEARSRFAEHVRASLQTESFFQTPYEVPENIFKLPGESDREACERLCEYKVVSVGVLADFGSEGRVDWEANPTYNEYKEWTWQLNRHNEWKMLAHEYRESGDERYAQLVADMFASWVAQTKCPEGISGYASKCYRTIECGIRMGSNWPYVLHAFCHSPAFTDDHLVAWYKSVFEQGRRLENDKTSGNWLIMEMNGLAQVSILFPEFKRSRVWLKLALEALEGELARQIYPDGFQYELTTGYHDVVINNYQRLFECMKTRSMEIPVSMLGILARAAEVHIKLMMPNGYLPDINDGTKASAEELLLPKLRIFPNHQTLRWGASGRKEGKQPDYLSCVLPHSGIGIYRSGWGKADTWLLFDAGPFGKAHQHEDKLSLLYFSGGKLLLTEGGNYAYDDSKMRRYVLSSYAHNTVLVDGQGQNRRKDYQWHEEDIQKVSGLKWQLKTMGTSDAAREEAYFNGSYCELYGEDISDVRHERSVYVKYLPELGVKPVLIVVDRMTAEREHEYTSLWHVDSMRQRGRQRSGCIDFEDIHLFYSENLSASLVYGQETPAWQGFVSVTSKQGDYRPVNCVQLSAKGKDVRMLTVFAVEDVLEGLRADTAPEAEELTLISGRSTWRLSEKEMRSQ